MANNVVIYIPVIKISHDYIPHGTFTDPGIALAVCRDVLSAQRSGVEIIEQEHQLRYVGNDSNADAYLAVFKLDDRTRADKEIPIINRARRLFMESTDDNR